MSKVTKGKQATRGLKLILVENQETVQFYLRVLTISSLTYLAVQYLFFWDNFTTKYISLFIITSSIALLAFYFMKKMAKPEMDEGGLIIGAGSDLNMQGHISEYFKDIILFTVIVHALSLFSNYLWFTLIIVPIYGFILIWKNFLGPWFFAPAPENQEQADPNQKKVKEKKKIVRVR